MQVLDLLQIMQTFALCFSSHYLFVMKKYFCFYMVVVACCNIFVVWHF